MANIALEYKNVYKKFEGSDRYAVSDVSLQIEENDFVTILGTSGSGKTTLLKMVNRIYELTSGTIELFGENIMDLDVNEYRRHIGYVIQQGGLFPHKTVEDNIATVPKLLKWDEKMIKERTKELMELVQLDYETYRKRYPNSLSGGEQQRVGIARALAVKPRLMLMDEPFGAIDAITRSKLQQELLRLYENAQNTILFVTHDVFEAILLGKKIIVMDDGKVQQYDTPYNILLHPANEFVSRLVRSGDQFDKLRALSLEYLTEPANEEEIHDGIRIDGSKHLNEALLLMLQNDASHVIVIGDDGNVKGKIEMSALKQLLQ